jgi:hypothetical protein
MWKLFVGVAAFTMFMSGGMYLRRTARAGRRIDHAAIPS